MDKVVAIIQARMGSSRLSGKVLMDIAGQPMLWHVVMRARQAKTLDDVVVATTTSSRDDAVADLCRQYGVAVFRGSEDDVLDRYYQAAKRVGASAIVRLTADCPLLDHGVIDQVVSRFCDGTFDYVSNTNPPTFPDGLDTEVFSCKALERAWREARWHSQREHVTPYLRTHPELFRIGNVENGQDLSELRWTVDEHEDLAFVRAVCHVLGDTGFGMADIIDLLTQRPELAAANAHFKRDEGLKRSLEEDYQL